MATVTRKFSSLLSSPFFSAPWPFDVEWLWSWQCHLESLAQGQEESRRGKERLDMV
jgi:hypothetical protein